MEPERVGNDERGDAEQRVGDNVERDEQPVVADHHGRASAQRDRDERLDLVAEPGAAERVGVARGWRRCRSDVPSAVARCASANAVDRRLVDQKAGLAGDDRFERAAAAQRDDRPAARLRLERDDAEVLLARQQHDCGAPIQVADVVVRQAAEELGRPPPAARSSAGAFRAVADDRQRHPCEAARVDRQVDPFVWDKGRHDEREPLGASNRQDEKSQCRRADTRQWLRDYSIGGSSPQHNER